jgi:hypothetical protein
MRSIRHIAALVAATASPIYRRSGWRFALACVMKRSEQGSSTARPD